jgi:uncharacterized membrane protein YfcA
MPLETLTWADQAILLAAALVANWFSALAGGGAGLLQFPVLIFLGLPFALALATHKIATVALGLGSTLRHLQGESLERRLSLVLLLAGVPGVVLGARYILEVPGDIAQQALGVLTIGMGLYSIARPRLGLTADPRNRRGTGLALGGLGIFVIGILNGSLSSGSGLVLTLWQVKWFGLDYKRATAHTLALCGLIWNGTGALVLGTIGEVAWAWIPALLVGSFVGGYLGSHYAIGKSNAWVKRVFEVVTLAVGVRLLC